MNAGNSTLQFSNLSYQVKTKTGEVKTLVDDVSLEVKAGELLAIMVHIRSHLHFIRHTEMIGGRDLQAQVSLCAIVPEVTSTWAC